MSAPYDAITLHTFPDPRLSPNRNAPGRTVKRLRAQLRRDVGLAVAAQLDPERRANPPARAAVVVHIHWPPRRRIHDEDNIKAAMKGGLDGLVDGGAIAGDSPTHLTSYVIHQHKADDLEPAIYVEIHPEATP